MLANIELRLVGHILVQRVFGSFNRKTWVHISGSCSWVLGIFRISGAYFSHFTMGPMARYQNRQLVICWSKEYLEASMEKFGYIYRATTLKFWAFLGTKNDFWPYFCPKSIWKLQWICLFLI